MRLGNVSTPTPVDAAKNRIVDSTQEPPRVFFRHVWARRMTVVLFSGVIANGILTPGILIRALGRGV